ncbi:hypothetical protein HRbin40_00316 [bacterium HR40]|nr:hypothetical protein HRbin40_00316 [bacterium HR40]
MSRYFAILAFLATIPAANWMVGHVGSVCVPAGPCLLPVAPGLLAPSGVVMIGLALVLRDIVQLVFGLRAVVGAILAGAVLSTLVAPTALALASGAAFLLSESFDAAIYTPLARKRLYLAVLASGLLGATVDSLVFLWLAFGVDGLQHTLGQVVGKLEANLAALPLVAWVRHGLVHPAAAGTPLRG